jgi:general secretion pathway protein I
MSPMKSSSSKGFTLLEILLAIAILGVAVTVIMQQFSAGLRIARVSRTYTTATIHAKQILEEYLLADEMEEGEASGTFDDGYAWNVIIEAYEDYKKEEGATEEEQDLYEHLPLEMFRIESVVSWMEGDRENSVALATLKTVKKLEEEKM